MGLRGTNDKGAKRTMTVHKRIILAVCNGAHNTRQIAKYLGMPLSTVNSYFYASYTDSMINQFTNGDLLQWTPGKCNTMQPGPNLLRIWRGGQVVDVYSKCQIDMIDYEIYDSDYASWDTEPGLW